jgi:hypothetical protein
MTELDSVEACLARKNPGAAELFRRFEQIVESCGPSEVSPRSSIVYWKAYDEVGPGTRGIPPVSEARS